MEDSEDLIGQISSAGNIDGAVMPSISDVKVDGTSVVDLNGCANVDLSGKVDKVEGKGLSSNDYSNTEKEKVVNNTLARHSHSNKSILDATTASFTTEDKTKLDSLENTTIEDNLTSTSTDHALSSNQGRILNENKVEVSSNLDSTDLDTIKTQTNFRFCQSCTNIPSGAGNGYLFVQRGTSANYVAQTYINAFDGAIYKRVCYGGNWKDWKQLITETTSLENSDFISDVLQNSWSTNGLNRGIALSNGIKILTMSVRRGTSTTVGTLPTSLRPSSAILGNAGNGSAAGYISISTDGVMTISSNIFTSGSSNLIFTLVYV